MSSNVTTRKIPQSYFCDKDDLFVPSFRTAHPTRKIKNSLGRYKVSRYFEITPFHFVVK